jgi:hypothetical protein
MNRQPTPPDGRHGRETVRSPQAKRGRPDPTLRRSPSPCTMPTATSASRRLTRHRRRRSVNWHRSVEQDVHDPCHTTAHAGPRRAVRWVEVTRRAHKRVSASLEFLIDLVQEQFTPHQYGRCATTRCRPGALGLLFFAQSRLAQAFHMQLLHPLVAEAVFAEER